MNRIRINVSGEIFETDLDLVKKKEFGKLMELYDETIKLGNATEVIVNRPRNTFGAILSYFLTGELHLPENACPNVFKRELEFWEVGCQKMQDCCQYKLQAFLFEEATRQKYLSKSLKDSTNSKAIIHPGTGLICRMRDKLWRLVDNADESVAAKIYFGIVFVMVLLSIIGLALSTDPSYRRRLTTCEVLDYMDLTNHPGFDDAMDYLGDPDCKDLLLLAEKYFGDEKNDKPHPRPHYQKNGETERSRGSGGPGGSGDSGVAAASWISPPSTTSTTSTTSSTTTTVFVWPKLPDMTLPVVGLVYLDFLVNAFFSIDLLLRLVSCPSLKQYFLSPLNLVDAIALLSSYIYLIVVLVKRELRYQDSKLLYILEFIQVFRALRLFRVVKNVRASRVLAYSITQNLHDMSLLVMLLIVGISTFACLFYLVEDRDSVRSIPMAWYWAIITMTTVGYGDLSPSTTVGYVLATVCAISGVLLLSITLPMFVNNFLCLYLYSCVDDAMDKTETKEEEFCDDSSDILTSENSETADEMGKSTIILVKESEEGYAENKRF